MPVISTNLAANTALKYLNRNSAMQMKSLQKISSGSRIVTAADDAAGLAIATRLNADIEVLKESAKNAKNGMAVLQFMDGSLSKVADILIRMKQLAAAAKSGAVDSTSRGYLNQEWVQLRLEILDINVLTSWQGQRLTAGSYNQDFMVGTEATDVISLNFLGNDFDFRPWNMAIGGPQLLTTFGINTALNGVDTDLEKIGNARAVIGALQSRFQYRLDYISTQSENLLAAKSNIMDTDIAAETINLTNLSVLTEASIAALVQANDMTKALLALVRPNNDF